jgi:diguanylate cyclase (GGDEF)-like protein
LVDRVRDTREALVVTGSEEGVALGSHSSRVHGLRSIMVAPLLLKGRLLGVVYLDSRAVKGIFTTADVEILAAITNQVALALETARAAQLEIAVRSAERDRDIAQLLHTAMADVGGTLDPDVVARRLLASAAGILSADAAVLVRLTRDGAADAIGHGTVAAHPTVDPALAAVVTSTAAAHNAPESPIPVPAVLGSVVTSWLTAPVTLRGEQHGVLLAGTSARRYAAADVDIATALAVQGAVAMENALLFQQVQELATRDGLTGLFNRRHFFELAERSMNLSRRYDRPLAAAMTDIDHFKGVNDTHGHAVGDEVIREVAHRLRAVLRAPDMICRYGGEEFAVLLPETGAADVPAVAARLHRAVTEHPVDTAAGPLRITVSVGVAGLLPEESLETLLKKADEALYAAKRAGRDRIAVAAT